MKHIEIVTINYANRVFLHFKVTMTLSEGKENITVGYLDKKVTAGILSSDLEMCEDVAKRIAKDRVFFVR